MKKIKKLIIQDIGIVSSSDGEIESFSVNGEMASITWYRQGNREFNGKYVMEIEYESTSPPTSG